MKIRDANFDDVQDLKKLSIQLGYDAEESLILENLMSLQKKPFSKVFVACTANRVIGYVALEKYETLYFEPGVNISGLVVLKEWRGKGIGSALLKATENYALENSLAFVRANSGIEREEAHVFYRKNKYSDEKEQKRFIKFLKY